MNTNSYSPSGESFFAKKWTKRQQWTARLAAGGAVLTVAIAAVAFASRYGGSSAATAPSETDPIPVAVVVMKPLSEYTAQRSYTGTLVAARASTLSFELAGKVVSLEVDQGDSVTEGQILARLDDRHLRARIRQTEAQRAQQAAILDELIAGPRKEQIAAAEADVRRLTAQLKLQQATKLRRLQLKESNAISQESLDDAVFGTDAAQGQLDAARSQLEELKEGTRLEQIEAQKAQVAQLDAQLADLKLEQEDTQLVAPYSGTIAQRNVDEGTVITPGTAIYRLVQHEPIEAWFGLPPEVAGKLKIGDSFSIDVEKQTRQGIVTGIVPELDNTTRTQTVVLTLDGKSSQGLVPAQVARLVLESSRKADGFWLPNSALLQGSRGLWSVYVVEEAGTVARREVEILYSESERSFVRGTLLPDEQVVASGINRLVPGVQVQVISGSESP
ncbi:efflux RND transporter periplasmic adaptor subunit [Blastopirellula marina]|uniref:Efflux transporter periplasmic adaptor subunit n=1 Tax=Blastopirellula marina TaxID=124 RepID=A0A2S8G8B5_9BACT|nr:efflux RND transporter periplasmic adaptor subunit [Blastopirellula marina]PQO40679.1 efflux transporter periplasmic adaptor subunit [Blastopirellula marina]PTL45639.1 efflux RND transporter periplasmic adaptor subunit [Blastopirellula marina]